MENYGKLIFSKKKKNKQWLKLVISPQNVSVTKNIGNSAC